MIVFYDCIPRSGELGESVGWLCVSPAEVSVFLLRPPGEEGDHGGDQWGDQWGDGPALSSPASRPGHAQSGQTRQGHGPGNRQYFTENISLKIFHILLDLTFHPEPFLVLIHNDSSDCKIVYITSAKILQQIIWKIFHIKYNISYENISEVERRGGEYPGEPAQRPLLLPGDGLHRVRGQRQ